MQLNMTGRKYVPYVLENATLLVHNRQIAATHTEQQFDKNVWFDRAYCVLLYNICQNKGHHLRPPPPFVPILLI